MASAATFVRPHSSRRSPSDSSSGRSTERSAGRSIRQSARWLVVNTTRWVCFSRSWRRFPCLSAPRGDLSFSLRRYVLSRTGWFSDRSAGYLASGRPVLVEETGFSDWLSTGLGVVPFTNLAEAIDGARDIDARYDQHCRYARSLAEEYFDSGKVLADLIEQAESPAPAGANPSPPART